MTDQEWNDCVEACAVAAMQQDRTGHEWVRDSLWANILKRAGDEVRKLKRPVTAQSDNGGRAVIEDGAVVIRFPLDAMQSALDGAWGMHIFDKRQKITNLGEFAEEFRNELNAESENGTTLIHRMADEVFLNMMEQGAFGFEPHEDQSL